MQNHRRFASLAAVVIAAGSLFTAASVLTAQPPAGERPAQPGQPGQARQPGRQPGLGGAMRQLEEGLKILKTDIADAAKRDDNLQTISRMEQASITAKRARADQLKPGANLDDFRRAQIKLTQMLLELEIAVLDGKTDAAKAQLAKIEAHEEESHGKFAAEAEKEG